MSDRRAVRELIFMPSLSRSLSFLCPDDVKYVTYGSAIKLKSRETEFYLNSETKNLNTGSGQQLVTFVKDPGTHNALWWIRPEHHGTEYEYPNAAIEGGGPTVGSPVRCGDYVRFTHVETMRNLHSHGVESPLSRQQEVTAYGEGDGEGDGGDNWRVQCQDPAAKYWVRSSTVRLFHRDTGKYLGSASNLEFNAKTCGQNCPIMGHKEAFARAANDKYADMYVDQGVHISQ